MPYLVTVQILFVTELKPVWLKEITWAELGEKWSSKSKSKRKGSREFVAWRTRQMGSEAAGSQG